MRQAKPGNFQPKTTWIFVLMTVINYPEFVREICIPKATKSSSESESSLTILLNAPKLVQYTLDSLN